MAIEIPYLRLPSAPPPSLPETVQETSGFPEECLRTILEMDPTLARSLNREFNAKYQKAFVRPLIDRVVVMRPMQVLFPHIATHNDWTSADFKELQSTIKKLFAFCAKDSSLKYDIESYENQFTDVQTPRLLEEIFNTPEKELLSLKKYKKRLSDRANKFCFSRTVKDLDMLHYLLSRLPAYLNKTAHGDAWCQLLTCPLPIGLFAAYLLRDALDSGDIPEAILASLAFLIPLCLICSSVQSIFKKPLKEEIHPVLGQPLQQIQEQLEPRPARPKIPPSVFTAARPVTAHEEWVPDSPEAPHTPPDLEEIFIEP